MFFITISLISYFLIRRITNLFHSFLLIGINIALILFFFEYEFKSFSDDSELYYNNTKFIFENYNLVELILILFNLQEADDFVIIEVNNLFSKIYIFFYIIFYFAEKNSQLYLCFIYYLNVFQLCIW